VQLVEGATLAEVVESESEKKKKFTEDRLWKISIQLCTALRYLHKDAKVGAVDSHCGCGR
jgi:serine/threonine protein kinase